MGFEVTATGGITYDDLDMLAGLPLFAVICGRSIRNAKGPGRGSPTHQGTYAKTVGLTSGKISEKGDMLWD